MTGVSLSSSPPPRLTHVRRKRGGEKKRTIKKLFAFFFSKLPTVFPKFSDEHLSALRMNVQFSETPLGSFSSSFLENPVLPWEEMNLDETPLPFDFLKEIERENFENQREEKQEEAEEKIPDREPSYSEETEFDFIDLSCLSHDDIFGLGKQTKKHRKHRSLI